MRRPAAFTLYVAVAPFLLMFFVLAFALGSIAAVLVVPRLWLARQMYWSCPFVPVVFDSQGARGKLLRIGFEVSYTLNVVKRLVTLPLRRFLPAFYIAGFPKCGTTSLASQLRRHPAVSGLAGLPYHEVLNKESHFLNGVLGRHHANSRLLYQSFFPTIFTKFWAEHVIGVEQWMAFDACPLTACLPFTAKRLSKLTPNAKFVFMIREPAKAIFSGEVMLRNMGMPLEWTLSEEVQALGSIFEEQEDETQLWREMEGLGPDDPLPVQMPDLLYTRLNSLMRFCDYPERLAPFLEHFPAENLMFIDFTDFVKNPEIVIRSVLDFLGLEQQLFRYEQLPPGMKTEYGSRTIHPTAAEALRSYYLSSDKKLEEMTGRSFSWTSLSGQAKQGCNEGQSTGHLSHPSRALEMTAATSKLP